MGPRFLPTYKKQPRRGRVNYRDPEWPERAYVTAYKEPFYKGGRVRERVPSWTDRIQYHSLPDRCVACAASSVAGRSGSRCAAAG
jgi:hypothetical protein